MISAYLSETSKLVKKWLLSFNLKLCTITFKTPASKLYRVVQVGRYCHYYNYSESRLSQPFLVKMAIDNRLSAATSKDKLRQQFHKRGVLLVTIYTRTQIYSKLIFSIVNRSENYIGSLTKLMGFIHFVRNPL